MPLDSNLLEALIHESEGTSLDFKSAQYPFEKATDEEKSELLKDILAFANSWRRTTAYILIGVNEVKGGRSNIVGVAKHLDDAKLHQFVNGKTQRPVEFSYQEITIEGTTIGAIEIPLQERPTYLRRRYGKLSAHEVPIRDGSSTRAATPDEIAKMGAEQAIGSTPEQEPRFRIWLEDGEGREVKTIEAEHYIFQPMSSDDIRNCIHQLKSAFPLATDFGSSKSAEKYGNTIGDRFLGMKYLYTPASDDEIAQYTDEVYPEWLKECEDLLSHLHESLQIDIGQPCFTFAVVNEGTRPGNDALVNIIAEGGLQVCTLPAEHDRDERNGGAGTSLPHPPHAPRGRWTHRASSWRGFESAISALANPLSGIGPASYPSVDSSLLLSSIARDNRRDPNAFYYKPGRPNTPQKHFSLECEQWRHGTGEEYFQGHLFFDLYKEQVCGTLTCEVHAENLATPVKRTFPVAVSIRRSNTADRALLLIKDLLKASK